MMMNTVGFGMAPAAHSAAKPMFQGGVEHPGEGKVVAVNPTNFVDEVLKSDKPVLLDFYADWCGPCRMVGPTVDRIAEKYDGQIKVAKFDVGRFDADKMAFVKQFGFDIKGIPAIFLINPDTKEAVKVSPQQYTSRRLSEVIDQFLDKA